MTKTTNASQSSLTTVFPTSSTKRIALGHSARSCQVGQCWRASSEGRGSGYLASRLIPRRAGTFSSLSLAISWRKSHECLILYSNSPSSCCGSRASTT